MRNGWVLTRSWTRVWVLLAAACHTTPAPTVRAASAPPSRRHPAPPPAAGPRDPREVHLGDLRQLTFEGENAEAYWSHDGKQIIFQSTRPPYACDQIFRMPVDAGGPEMELVSTGAGRTTCSYFFPGDRHVLFSSTHAASPECPPRPDFSKGYVWALYDTYDIYRARADGTELENLTRTPGYDAEATICDKDGSIVFTSTRDDDIELYRMDADGKNVKRLTHTPGYDGGAYFSPDCKQIVWRASRPKPGTELDDFQKLLHAGLVRPTALEIFVMNADGSDPHQVTDLGAGSFGPSWFPSGDRIIFASNYGDPKGREFELWAIDTNGTGLERITYTPGFDGFPMFSPDGTQLAFASNRHGKVKGETDVFVARWQPGGRATTEERSADRFYRDVAWLADDAREGRGVGTKGLEASIAYVEDQMRSIGLEPAGDSGSFRHGFDAPTALKTATASLVVDGKPVPLDGVVPAGFSASGSVGGKLVYAGYGISAPKLDHDDYQGLDVKGKVVLVRRFAPEGGRFDMDAERRFSEARYKAWNAREHGARAVVIADLADGEGTRAERELPHPVADTLGDAGLPVVWVKRAVAAPLVTGAHQVRLDARLEPLRVATANVVGRMRAGGDRQPGVIVIGAHVDHLGMGGPASLAPGVVAPHNGADDNASGVAGLLEIARTLKVHRAELRRDVVFVAFSGEELGDLGSTAFTKSPPGGLAVKDIVAMLNLDMVGRLREKLQVFGSETAADWATLVPPICDRHGLACELAPGGYGASDQTPFYANGVPVLHFFTGTHRDYHRPTDDAKLINATGGAAVASLVTDVALAVAAAPSLTVQVGPAPPQMGDLRAAGASLGTVPDYVGPPAGQPGVLLAGVRPGGPADQAGLKRGDILVALDGHAIKNVEDFMFALAAATPGKRAQATVVREGKKVDLPVVFGPPTRR